MEPDVLVGAYALTSSLSPLNPQDDARWIQALREEAGVQGLELPVVAESRAGDRESFIKGLPSEWSYVLTLLPGTMQSLALDPHFGLASGQADGRRAAIALAEQARRYVHRINEHCGRAAVKAIHLHSAPSGGGAGVEADGRWLRESLASLKELDWQGAELLLEHCDAWRAGQKPAKGFLDLESELGLTLNWGRSVVETRSSSGIEEHITLAQSRLRLRGFVFSGVAQRDPLYGDWEDNHAPIVVPGDKPWSLRAGLLDRAALASSLLVLQKTDLQFLALKVQPFPKSLTLEQRLAFFREQWAELRAALSLWPRWTLV
jgi:hypothetical protein